VIRSDGKPKPTRPLDTLEQWLQSSSVTPASDRLARVNGIGWLKELSLESSSQRGGDEVITRASHAEEARITASTEAGWLQIAGPIPAGPDPAISMREKRPAIRLGLAHPGPAAFADRDAQGGPFGPGLGLSMARYSRGQSACPERRHLIPSARAVLSQLHDSDSDRSGSDSWPFARCGESSLKLHRIPERGLGYDAQPSKGRWTEQTPRVCLKGCSPTT